MKEKIVKNGIMGKLISINDIPMDNILSPLSLEEILDSLYDECHPKNRHRINKKIFIKQLKFFIEELSPVKDKEKVIELYE